MTRLEGRNPVLECLMRAKRAIGRVYVDRGARPDARIRRIVALCERRNVPVERVERRRLDKLSEGRVHNGVIADVEPLRTWSTVSLLTHLSDRERPPFLLLADGLQYEHNLGAVLRSALGFGVDGVVIPTRRGSDITPVVQRVSMGAVEEVPIVQEGLLASAKVLSRAGIPLVAAEMGGQPMHEARLAGPLALVLGDEGRGVSHKLRERCDRAVSIPLRNRLESLNVSVAAAVIMAEKRRQDGWFSTVGG